MKKFWISVKREFQMLIWLSEGIKMSWRRERSGWIIATDASLTGAGACEAWFPKETLDNLLWEDGGFKNITHIFTWSNWTPIFQFQWGYPEHINVLEARALVMCIQNIIQRKDRMKDR